MDGKNPDDGRRSGRRWPQGKKFAFTIIDDTDNSLTTTVKPVYQLLADAGLRTTKTVWVYPPRDHFRGDCLADEHYLHWIRELQQQGFEIALHGVGSGLFSRSEIAAGLERYRLLLGDYPRIQINHAGNPDNIYWGGARFVFPLSFLYRCFTGKQFQGENPSAAVFWGDLCKRRIKYIRNHVFSGINTLSYDPAMPYRVRHKDRYSNYWFSSAAAPTVKEFNTLVSEKNIDRLEREEGCCIVYTHFGAGFTDSSGKLNDNFHQAICCLAGREGWFVPAGVLLDYLSRQKEREGFVSAGYLLRLDMTWLRDKLRDVLERTTNGE